jgi:hypothetical protein
MAYLICPNCATLTSERGSRLHTCIPCYRRLDRLVPLIRSEAPPRAPFEARLRRERRMARWRSQDARGESLPPAA